MHGLGNQVRTVTRVQLEPHILYVPFDGSWSDIDLDRDLLGRAADSDQFQRSNAVQRSKRFDARRNPLKPKA